ncbi:monocarboxylate transporter 12-like [Haliotis cracherodii]|uniref:monocarboxylate transporter 12-like n=1 Tax=Haliotis cracherodii TaxID=6455 RepID=UPI0039EC55EB
MARQKDTGWAWMCLLGTFCIRFILFGVLHSFGLIFIELIEHFGSLHGSTAWIGSLLSGLMFLFGPMDVFILRKLGTRWTAIMGAVLACVGCSVSFLADSLLFLYLSYGVLQGFGFSLLFLSATLTLNQYFEKRRSLANAVANIGSGVGTMAIVPLLQMMISEYTWRGALLITGGLVLNCAVFGALFRPFYTRQELSDMATESKNSGNVNTGNSIEATGIWNKVKPAFSVFINVRYTVVVIGVTLGIQAYFIPFNLLPDLANGMDIPEERYTWLISTIGISSIAGRLIFGRVTDMSRVNRVAFLGAASALCGVATLICPQLLHFETLLAYSVVYGLFTGVWTYLQAVSVADIHGMEKLSEGIGLMFGFQGISVLLGTPLAGWLYDITGNYATSFYVAGSLFSIGGAIILVFEVSRTCRKSELSHKSYQVEERVSDNIFYVMNTRH